MDREALKALLVRAGKYTARYEKTALEVEDKLLDWSNGEISKSEIEWIINQLIAEKFIDEKRFAERYVRDKLVMLRKGPILIRHELQDKGLSSSIIQKALDAIPYDDWFVALEEYIQPKLNRYKAKAKSSYDLWMRLSDLSYRRGYPSEIYEEVINKLNLESENDNQ